MSLAGADVAGPETVRVDLGARSYDVRIGAGLLARAGAEIAPLLRRPRVAVLTDENVAALHLDALRDGLGEVAMTALGPGPRARAPRPGPSSRAPWTGCWPRRSSAATS